MMPTSHRVLKGQTDSIHWPSLIYYSSYQHILHSPALVNFKKDPKRGKYFLFCRQCIEFDQFEKDRLTLDSGLSVAPWINLAPGTIGKNNKHSPLKKHIPLNQITEFWTFLWITLFNKDVAPKKIQKLISIALCLFWSLEYPS